MEEVLFVVTIFEKGEEMKSGQIVSVVEGYERRLQDAGVSKKRMDPMRTFATLTRDELLAHAYYLCDGVKVYAQNPQEQRKAGSRLTEIQMCLSFAGWYTLNELMDHNRSH